MNILFVINALEIGGAETFLMRLMKELFSREHRTFIYVLSPRLNNDSFEEAFYKETKTVLIKSPKPHNKLQSFLFYKVNAILLKFGYHDFYKSFLQRKTNKYFFRVLYKKYKIDLINSHLYASDIFASEVLKPVLNVPNIITMQGCYESVIALNDKEAVGRAVSALWNCDGFTYVADKNLDFFQITNTPVPLINKKIYNGLPVPDSKTFKSRKELGIKENDFVIGQISRSIESKGMDIAAKAVEYLVEQKGCQNIKLIVIGPENDYYMKLRSMYGTKSYMIFPGSTNDPLEWVGLFDIGILPTYFPSESCPSSIIEYLACGKPVVSTTIGEILNMIAADGEQAGMLVSFDKDNGKPSVTDIADSILSYYEDKALYQDHSKIAKRAFSKFDITKIAEMYIDIFKKVLI
jgi:glycosyltransferase involved in cell wall biosynthesis